MNTHEAGFIFINVRKKTFNFQSCLTVFIETKLRGNKKWKVAIVFDAFFLLKMKVKGKVGCGSS